MTTRALLHTIFVYGTLKTKQPNNFVMNDLNNGFAELVGKGVTKNPYPLVVASKYNVPFMLPLIGQGKNVHGEVYKVDNKMMEYLDDFEGHPTLYKRQEIPVNIDNKSELCWCYILQKSKPDLLQLPFLDSYDNNDPQISKYVQRCDRTFSFRPEVQLQ